MSRINEIATSLRFGPFRIVKGHVEARVYRVLVLDMRRKVGDRQVYRAQLVGWTKAERENAAAWIIEQARAEGLA
jgi:hypothetical protein